MFSLKFSLNESLTVVLLYRVCANTGISKLNSNHTPSMQKNIYPFKTSSLKKD